ncbi:MAG: class I mannose-6-phosphate isomerase [Muribaculaceae bacterium]|nr:class I mannose-6-phosphate isomerase [Muribaculaceae bacterium]
MASILKAPIVFHPIMKKVIWGGDKICKWKGLPSQDRNIGESWEISQIPGSESIVSQGKYKDFSLTQLIELFGSELLGEKVVEKYGKRFPLLVKFIDANDNLSVQVHPNDDLALARHKTAGKTEMWYVISADKGAKIYAGLKDELNADSYEDKLKDDSFLDSVEFFESKKEDVYYLPPGTVHAIGAGNLLTEIQQSSDITYRIYDYNRKDANGEPRELHTDLAKDAINFKNTGKCRIQDFNEKDGIVELIDCEYFSTSKINIDSKREFSLNGDSFRIIICTEGKVLLSSHGESVELPAGFSALIPASVHSYQLNGKGTVLITKAL